MTLIERAAFALRQAWDASPDLPPIEFTDGEAEALVLAIIKAIREPTARMCVAAANERENGDMELHARKWRAMIDASLAETSSTQGENE